MAKVVAFEIANFRGIQRARLSVEDGKPDGRFITLIGLNESGKTTLLEGLSHSSLADPDTSDLMESVHGKPELNDLIPKHEKSAFSGKITVEAEIELSLVDVDKIKQFLRDEMNLVLTKPFAVKMDLTKEYTYKDSNHIKSMHIWSTVAHTRKIRGTKPYVLSGHSNKSDWLRLITFVKTLLPQVIYFPTFLVDFPKRIYLEGNHGTADKYYRQVITDALEGLKKPLSLKTHILDRVSKHRKGAAAFSSVLRSSSEGQQIDAVVQDLANELNRVIFGAWSDIFGKKIVGRRVNVEWHIDEEKDRHIYIEVSILSFPHRYYVFERSLGFRWFFSFLLFTQFQRMRRERNKIIFLFDEPASHLHARAQQRLLQSFEKIADPDHVVIYSTHSHYLVNPLWLEKAYIVNNRSFDAELDDPNQELAERSTDIEVVKYRTYVSDNPGKTTYFQPALDALQYGVSPLSLSGAVVLLEGKYDYYPFRYLLRAIGLADVLQPFPATGAGTMGSLIAMLRGWGIAFVILLDDDAEGKKQKTRYQNDFLVQDDQIATLGEIVPALAGKAFESVFSGDVGEIYQALNLVPPQKSSKKDYYLLFQNALSKEHAVDMIASKVQFKLIVDGLKSRLELQSP